VATGQRFAAIATTRNKAEPAAVTRAPSRALSLDPKAHNTAATAVMANSLTSNAL
jgi:hypothetical protein